MSLSLAFSAQFHPSLATEARRLVDLLPSYDSTDDSTAGLVNSFRTKHSAQIPGRVSQPGCLTLAPSHHSFCRSSSAETSAIVSGASLVNFTGIWYATTPYNGAWTTKPGPKALSHSGFLRCSSAPAALLATITTSPDRYSSHQACPMRLQPASLDTKPTQKFIRGVVWENTTSLLPLWHPGSIEPLLRWPQLRDFLPLYNM